MDAIERLNAALGDRYRIERELGAGGMATVYLAEDLRHHRQVALKVLKPEIAATLGAGRFAREIEVAARLQHPNILPLHDSGEADGFFFYVMPYVEGESLRDRLARGGELPIPDAVRILMEVADALGEAHAHGVVHRDIKPENVMLRGRHALVTDFGVAKAVTAATGQQLLTSTGVALGTPTYMAPEQAMADPHQDHRVDIYALGVLGYELLTGRAPYSATTAQEMLAAHITAEPEPLERYRPAVPPALAAVILKCLAKKPADRWQTADELLQHLEPLATPSGGITPTGAAAVAALRRWPRWAGWTAGVAAAAAMLALWAGIRGTTRGATPQFVIGQSQQLTSDAGLDIQPAISPDGKLVAYSAGNSFRMRIFIRPVGGGRTIPLSDDTGAVEVQPRWSPDGTSILFLTRGGASIAPSLGGASRPIVPPSASAAVVSAAWSPDGRQIAFVRDDSLQVVDLEGRRVLLVSTNPTLNSCTWSPNGKWIACVWDDGGAVFLGKGFGNLSPTAILLFPAAGGRPIPLVEVRASNQSPVWSSDSRHLLFVSNRDGPRDVYDLPLASTGRARGAPIRLTTGLGALSISVSADRRHLVYAAYTTRANIWSLPVPDGAPVTNAAAVPVTRGNQLIESMRVSRDGRWLLYDSNLSGYANIYRIPMSGGEPERLTNDPFDDFAPDLSPDGRAVAYHSWRTGTRQVEVKPLDGGPVERVAPLPAQELIPMWSPDGRALAFWYQGTASPNAVFVARRGAGSQWLPATLLAEPAILQDWSPDGRAIAYRTPATPTEPSQLMIVSPDGGPARRVFYASPDGPTLGAARWGRDSRTLYFKAHDAQGRASFWAVSAAGGRPRLLARFTDPERPSYRDEFGTDGKRLYFASEERRSDIWVATLKW